MGWSVIVAFSGYTHFGFSSSNFRINMIRFSTCQNIQDEYGRRRDRIYNLFGKDKE